MTSKTTEWLREFYFQARKKNPSFSQRAFARKIGMTPGRTSEVLSGKRNLNEVSILKIAARLGLTAEAREELVAQLPQKKPSTAKAKTADTTRQLSLDSFAAIADWEHYAILNLVETHNFVPDIHVVSKRLGVPTVRIRQCVERLVRLGLLKVDGGTWKRATGNLSTPTDIASAALRASHKQSLEQAITSLEGVNPALRDITSITCALNIEKIPEAKKRITAFRRSLSKFLESGKRTEVYNINIQLVPVTKV